MININMEKEEFEAEGNLKQLTHEICYAATALVNDTGEKNREETRKFLLGALLNAIYLVDGEETYRTLDTVKEVYDTIDKHVEAFKEATKSFYGKNGGKSVDEVNESLRKEKLDKKLGDLTKKLNKMWGDTSDRD